GGDGESGGAAADDQDAGVLGGLCAHEGSSAVCSGGISLSAPTVTVGGVRGGAGRSRAQPAGTCGSIRRAARHSATSSTIEEASSPCRRRNCAASCAVSHQPLRQYTTTLRSCGISSHRCGSSSQGIEAAPGRCAARYSTSERTSSTSISAV